MENLAASFPAETLHADYVGRSRHDRVFHVEYIGKPDRDMAVQMIACLAHLKRNHPGCSITQYALVEGTGWLPSVDDPLTGLSLGLRTIYMRDQAASRLLEHPNTGVFSVLARGDNRDRTGYLKTAVHQMLDLPEVRRARLLHAISHLATVHLDPATVGQIIKKETGMTVESVAQFYMETDFGQLIQKRGADERAARLLTAQLRARFGDDSRIPAIAERLAQGTDDETIERLITEASSLDDLSGWLLSAQAQ